MVKDGTALIRKDYTVPNDDGTGPAIRSIDGFIEPGKTTGDLPVRILDDNLKEPTETFTATPTTPTPPTSPSPSTSPPPSPTTTDPTLSTHRPFSAADSGWWVLKEAVGE